MATVAVSQRASADIDEVIDWLTANAAQGVAVKYAMAFDEALTMLEAFPALGAPRPRLGRAIRTWAIAPYIVNYRIVNDVSILRILHGRRRITRRLVNQS